MIPMALKISEDVDPRYWGLYELIEQLVPSEALKPSMQVDIHSLHDRMEGLLQRRITAQEIFLVQSHLIDLYYPILTGSLQSPRRMIESTHFVTRIVLIWRVEIFLFTVIAFGADFMGGPRGSSTKEQGE